MIKSSMEFLDILFPVNLGPLTYRYPGEPSEKAQPGMVVSAPLRNKVTKGIVMGKSLKIPSGEIKEILNIHGEAPILSSKLIHLLKWMAEYYLAEQGLVLKNMLPKEAFTKIKQRKTKIPPHSHSISPLVRGDSEESRGMWGNYLIDIDDMTLSSLFDSIKKNTYGAFLLHAPSCAYEYSVLTKIFSEMKNAIILVPEVSLTNSLYPLLSERFGERVCLFHSGLSRGKRSEAIERILSGSSDIILGARSAVFAPLKQVSFIAVLHEHSVSYKQEESPRYHGRDVAVMRGYLEKATVLLSSICPSLESLFNYRAGKYMLLKSEADMKRPRVRVIDMKHEKLFKTYLSKKITDAAIRYIKNDKKVMFVLNRRGYSTLLQCADCNYIDECPVCKVPLIFHKQDFLVKCHYCGYIRKISESCNRCKGFNMELLGAGTQKAQEDIEELIGIKTFRIDSDMHQKRSKIESLAGIMNRDDIRIIIGTKLITRRLGINERFSMAAILNTDLFLNLPDFRSTEKVYQEISYIIDRVAPSGEVFIQTRMPQNYLFKCIKNNNYSLFLREELSRRKSLHYPPYARLLLLRFVSKKDLSSELSNIQKKINEEVEILGPSLSENKLGKYEFKLLLKSSIRGALHSVARTFINKYKESRDVAVKIDVDPISI